MHHGHRLSRGAALATFATALVATGANPALAAGAPGAAPTPDASSTRGSDAIHIAPDGSIRAPSVMSAGVTHLTVTGAAGEALQLVAPRHGETAATLVRDYQHFAGTGLPASTERDFRFVGGSFTGTDLYLYLPAGTYYAFDAGQPTVSAEHVAVVHVRGAAAQVTLPSVTGSIAAIRRDTWAERPTAIGPSGHLLFANASSDTHLVNLLQLRRGTTLAQVKAALADPDADVSTLSTGVYIECGVLSPGGVELVSYTLAPGTYAVLDLWPDDRTGRPHSALGMVRLIQVR
jgi:hypothetical protein